MPVCRKTQRQQALRRAVESDETRAVRLQNMAANNIMFLFQVKCH